jgi:hypothetical protein
VPTGPRRARTLQWPYWLIFHEDGVAGERRSADADAVVLEHALRYHGGGFAGSGSLPDEVPIIAGAGRWSCRQSGSWTRKTHGASSEE